jgi:hypothetical protein
MKDGTGKSLTPANDPRRGPGGNVPPPGGSGVHLHYEGRGCTLPGCLFGIAAFVFLSIFAVLLIIAAGIVSLFGGRRIARILLNRAIKQRQKGAKPFSRPRKDDPDIIDVEATEIKSE